MTGKRENFGWSFLCDLIGGQEEAGALFGIHRTAVSHFAMNRRQPNAATRKRIARRLGAKAVERMFGKTEDAR